MSSSKCFVEEGAGAHAKHEGIVRRIVSNVDKDGYLRHRESAHVEFKANYNQGNIEQYSRTLAAYANNNGGYIIFGIGDSPRLPIGISKEKFDNLKQERISTFLLEHFAPEIVWESGLIFEGGKYYGFLFAFQAAEKPVVCTKNGGDGLKDGEIYYRYRAQTKRIEYPELRRILDEAKTKERILWMKHIEKIAKIGSRNVAFIDMLNGDIQTSKLEGSKLLMDKSLLDELKRSVAFIEEGKFSETDGQPTLKIIGQIQAVDGVIAELEPDRDYPYIQKQLAEKLGVRPYDVTVLVWKYQLKGNKKYHLPVGTGTTDSQIHKFSDAAYVFLHEIINENQEEGFLNSLAREYRSRTVLPSMSISMQTESENGKSGE